MGNAPLPLFRTQIGQTAVPISRGSAAGMVPPSKPKPSASVGVKINTVKNAFAPLCAVGTLILTGGCTTGREPAAAQWESQVATNLTEANQMEDKGWTVAGYTSYTDATGRPQTDYMMQKPKR